MELNPVEAVRNNALATRLMARIAGETGVGTFVLVSTDKAVKPATVMGASKVLAEWAVEAAAVRHPATTYSIVRFGNVLGSSGSVVPIFRRHIAAGGPVTITDLQLNEIIPGLRQMLRRSIPESIAIELRLAPDLWTVRADAGQLGPDLSASAGQRVADHAGLLEDDLAARRVAGPVGDGQELLDDFPAVGGGGVAGRFLKRAGAGGNLLVGVQYRRACYGNSSEGHVKPLPSAADRASVTLEESLWPTDPSTNEMAAGVRRQRVHRRHALLWVPVDDEPGRVCERGCIEANCIAL